MSLVLHLVVYTFYYLIHLAGASSQCMVVNPVMVENLAFCF